MKQSRVFISIILIATAFFLSISCSEKVIENGGKETLRVDYIFSGNSLESRISLSELIRFDGWAGRDVNRDKVALKGNGQIKMYDNQSKELIYCQSFSTLFQEWLATEEATKVDKSFENVFLLPMPERKATITIELYNFYGQTMTSLTHEVDPEDILIRKLGGKPAPHKYLLKNGNSSEKIDIAIVAEGYTKDERAKFYKDAQIAMEAILSHKPFDQYRDRFNFVAVALESTESGVSVPINGEWRESALNSHFSTFYSDRYLTTLHITELHNQMVGIPYEHFVILANTDTYGGGGIFNSYTLTTTGHKSFKPVVVHEFGHSFAGLADEYFYDDQFVEYYYPEAEPWEQNITTLYNFQSKWEDLLPDGCERPTPLPNGNIWEKIAEGTNPDSLIGLYEGGGYQSKGVYRPFVDCRMHTNSADAFCPICQRAISRIIDFYTIELE